MSCYSEAEIAEVVIDIIRNNPGIRTSEMISEACLLYTSDAADD